MSYREISDKLKINITVVNTEEMLLRVRLTHYPNEVKQIINE